MGEVPVVTLDCGLAVVVVGGGTVLGGGGGIPTDLCVCVCVCE